jgi:predicted Fe-S protein YdhL (DUF1289 family)
MERSYGSVTPCKSICKLSDEGEYCIGCYRTRQEIEHWLWMSEHQKQKIMQELKQRELHLKK